ncbi:MAG: hypothetical protein ACRYGA_00100 [Janthinobacterium lividum]
MALLVQVQATHADAMLPVKHSTPIERILNVGEMLTNRSFSTSDMHSLKFMKR